MPVLPHEMLIVPGSAVSVGTGQPPNLRREADYPVEAVCTECRQVVRREKPQAGRLDWPHTGRLPEEP